MNDTELEQLKEQIDSELKEIFEQPVIRKQKVDAILALIKQRETRLQAEARIDELKQVNKNWFLHNISFVSYFNDRIKELMSTLKQESEE